MREKLEDAAVGSNLPVGQSEQYLIGLQLFIPEVMCDVHAEWRYESLDGLHPLTIYKSGPLELELLGSCILITDQRAAPIHLRLQLDQTEDRISWLECRLGENIGGKLKRGDLSYSMLKSKVVSRSPEAIHWYYIVGFGVRK